MPRIGIVMRTKDRPATLARALGSVLSQSERDWAVALVNDGGDAEALEAYVDRETPEIRPRLRVVHHAASEGRWPAANAGVRALGDCGQLVLLDDDDSWAPRFLETTSAALTDAPARVGAVYSRVVEVLETIEDGVLRERRRRAHMPELSAITIATLAQFNHIVPNGLVYRASLHEEVGPYDETLPVLGDWEFYLRVIRHRDIRLLAEPLAFWHKRPAAGQTGAYANSVIGAEGLHHETEAAIRNRYLRADMDAGLIGMGTLMTLGRQSMRVDEVVQIMLRRSGVGAEGQGLRGALARLSARLPRWR